MMDEIYFVIMACRDKYIRDDLIDEGRIRDGVAVAAGEFVTSHVRELAIEALGKAMINNVVAELDYLSKSNSK